MKVKRYDELESGDIGRFGASRLYWIATGPFEPDGYVDETGRVYGHVPIVANEKRKKDRVCYLQGCADTQTQTYELV